MKYLSSSVCSLLLLTAIFSIVSGHATADQQRLIVGFYEKDYQEFGSPENATVYLNEASSRMPGNAVFTLIRPMGNQSILVSMPYSGRPSLQQTINQISQLEKVRYIDLDSRVTPYSEKTQGL